MTRVAHSGSGGSPRVVRLEQDGLAIYHVADDGPARAALMFRVGRGDEQAAISGVTHLVEHLALFPFAQQPFEYNGFVDPIRTMFVAAGKPQEIASFLEGLCHNLGALPLERLATEQRVLRDESARRSASPPDHHGWLRWGLHGPGLAFISELGLWRLTADEISAWSRHNFAAGNAALVWVGDQPPRLELELPPGPRRPTPDLVDLVGRPTWAVGPPDQAAISFVMQRDSAEAAGVQILAKRLQRQLRYERGLSYDVQLLYQPLSSAAATATLWATCGAGDAAVVRDLVIETALAVGTEGPSVEELEADVDAVRRSREHPFAAQGEADRLAFQELLGAPSKSLEALEAELAAVTPESARDAFSRILETALLTQPQAVEPPATSWLTTYPELISATPPDGQRFVSAQEGAYGLSLKGPRLVVGDEGIGVEHSNGQGAFLAWERVAALAYSEDGTATILHSNGSQLSLSPAHWRDAKALQERLTSAVPAERVIRMSEKELPAWTNTWMSLVAFILSIIGMAFLLNGAFVLLEPAPPAPIAPGPVTFLMGLVFAATAALLPVLAFGAGTFRRWSWVPAAWIILGTLVCLGLGVVVHAVSAALLLAVPSVFAGLHLWKISGLRRSRPRRSATT